MGRQVFCFGGAIIIVTCLAPSASATHIFDFTFYQSPETGGGLKYGLQLSNLIFGQGLDKYQKLVAPDGTEFLLGANRITERNSFADLAAFAFGTWNVTETLSGVDYNYTLDVQPFTLDGANTDIPIITSPQSGTSVPPQFRLSWMYQSGNVPNGFGSHYTGSLNVLPLTFEDYVRNPCCSTNIKTALVPPGTGQANIFIYLSSKGADISRHGGPSDTYQIFSDFEARSATASYTVVPEPSTQVMSVILGVGAAMTLGIKRKSFRLMKRQ